MNADTVEVAEGTSVSELYSMVFPPEAEGQIPVMYAVNQRYVSSDHVLSEGDELAFVPPLGGG